MESLIRKLGRGKRLPNLVFSESQTVVSNEVAKEINKFEENTQCLEILTQ